MAIPRDFGKSNVGRRFPHRWRVFRKRAWDIVRAGEDSVLEGHILSGPLQCEIWNAISCHGEDTQILTKSNGYMALASR